MRLPGNVWIRTDASWWTHFISKATIFIASSFGILSSFSLVYISIHILALASILIDKKGKLNRNTQPFLQNSLDFIIMYCDIWIGILSILSIWWPICNARHSLPLNSFCHVDASMKTKHIEYQHSANAIFAVLFLCALSPGYLGCYHVVFRPILFTTPDWIYERMLKPQGSAACKLSLFIY